PWKKISPAVGVYSLASSRAMVLLPLPLSPARATISRSPMARLTSSTACRVRRDSALPILKCLVRCSVRSGALLRASGQEAAPLGGAGGVQGGRVVLADVHDLRAAGGEPAAGGRAGQ